MESTAIRDAIRIVIDEDYYFFTRCGLRVKVRVEFDAKVTSPERARFSFGNCPTDGFEWAAMTIFLQSDIAKLISALEATDAVDPVKMKALITLVIQVRLYGFGYTTENIQIVQG